jgi:diguanylate cyclase (GGDEF)-like protein
MIRDLIRRHGVIKVTVGATLLSILLSLLIMLGVRLALRISISSQAYITAILSPAIIAPLLSYKTIDILAQLDEAERRLLALSITDELTGAFNRRHFFALAAHELERAERYHGHFSIAVLDFDNFKLINDHFGHMNGDRALREVSQICRQTIRENDIFGRFGGDEFIFLFPETDEEEAKQCLQRIVEMVSLLSFESQGRAVDPRVSIGVHSYGPKSTTLDAILEKADLALYKSKQTGGGKVSW